LAENLVENPQFWLFIFKRDLQFEVLFYLPLLAQTERLCSQTIQGKVQAFFEDLQRFANLNILMKRFIRNYQCPSELFIKPYPKGSCALASFESGRRAKPTLAELKKLNFHLQLAKGREPEDEYVQP